MKSMAELMLKDTPYERILHGNFQKSETELIKLLDGLDFVVEEWQEAMLEHNVPDIEIVASEILCGIIGCRYAVLDYWRGRHEGSRNIGYLEAVKSIQELKSTFIKLAKPYLHTPFISNWYLDLPIKVEISFKHIQRRMMDEGLEGGGNNGNLHK